MESRLKTERLRRNLSQARIAEIAGVDTGTVSRWECGQNEPSLDPLRRLCDFFGMSAKELGFDGDRLLPQNTAFRRLTQDPIARLAHLALFPSTDFEKMSRLMKQASEDAIMNFQSTRRDLLKGALSSLVFLPLASSSEGARWETILEQCTVGLAACEELRKSGDGESRRLAFDTVGAYLGILPTIARDSTRLREPALYLIARCALLRTILGWHCSTGVEAIDFAKKALFFCKQTGDISFQLSAYSKLAWAYFYENRHREALNVATEAGAFLEQSLNQPVPTCVRGGTYSTLALMQAKNKIQSDEALGKATEFDPGIEEIAFMEFTRDHLPFETGFTYCHAGNQVKAMEIFEQVVDPITLTYKLDRLRKKAGETPSQGMLRAMALSSLKSKDRDMEKVVHFWIAGLEQTKLLRSEWGFRESVALYEDMEMVWPGEPCIANLRDLIVHW